MGIPRYQKTLELADLLKLEDYIEKRKNTIFGFAENLQLYKECELSSKINRGENNLVWWPENCIRCNAEISNKREQNYLESTTVPGTTYLVQVPVIIRI